MKDFKLHPIRCLLSNRVKTIGLVCMLAIVAVLSAVAPANARRTRGESLLEGISTKLITLKAMLNEVTMRGYLGEDVGQEKEAMNEDLGQFFLNDENYKFIIEGLEKASDDSEIRRFNILKLYFDFQRISLLPYVNP